MIRAAMEAANLTLFPNLSLFIFVSWFLLTILWLYRKNSHGFYQELSQIPFEEPSQIINPQIKMQPNGQTAKQNGQTKWQSKGRS